MENCNKNWVSQMTNLNNVFVHFVDKYFQNSIYITTVYLVILQQFRVTRDHLTRNA